MNSTATNPCHHLDARALTTVLMDIVDTHGAKYSKSEYEKPIYALSHMVLSTLCYLRDMHGMDFDWMGFSSMASFVGVLELVEMPELDDTHRVLLDSYISNLPNDVRQAYRAHDRVHTIIAEAIEVVELGVELPDYEAMSEAAMDDLASELSFATVPDKNKLN